MWPDSPELEIIRQGDQREGWVWFILQDNHKYCSNLGGSYESVTSSQSSPLIDYGSITASFLWELRACVLQESYVFVTKIWDN